MYDFVYFSQPVAMHSQGILHRDLKPGCDGWQIVSARFEGIFCKEKIVDNVQGDLVR